MFINPLDDLLRSLGEEENENNDDGNDDSLLSSLLEDKEESQEEADILSGLLSEEEGEENEEEQSNSTLDEIFSSPAEGDIETEDGELQLADIDYKYEKRPARLDITQNSKTDHRVPRRYTVKELQMQLKRDYKYMKGKGYFMIQPFMMMMDYPYKKQSKDADEVNADNAIYDYAFVIGRLRRWNSTEEFKNKKSYIMGDVMYVKKGYYYVDGKTEPELLLPHLALVFRKKREKKTIKNKRFRDVLEPLKQVLRSGKPHGIYKDFPKLHKLAR